MTAHPYMQKPSLAEAENEAHDFISKTVTLQGVSVTQVTFNVSAKWSNDLKSYAENLSCSQPFLIYIGNRNLLLIENSELPLFALVLSGTLKVVMDDGEKQELSREGDDAAAWS